MRAWVINATWDGILGVGAAFCTQHSLPNECSSVAFGCVHAIYFSSTYTSVFAAACTGLLIFMLVSSHGTPVVSDEAALRRSVYSLFDSRTRVLVTGYSEVSFCHLWNDVNVKLNIFPQGTEGARATDNSPPFASNA